MAATAASSSFPSTVTVIRLPQFISRPMTARSSERAAVFAPLLRRTLLAETGGFPHQIAHGPSLQRVLIGQNVAELFHEHLSSLGRVLPAAIRYYIPTTVRLQHPLFSAKKSGYGIPTNSVSGFCAILVILFSFFSSIVGFFSEMTKIRRQILPSYRFLHIRRFNQLFYSVRHFGKKQDGRKVFYVLRSSANYSNCRYSVII